MISLNRKQCTKKGGVWHNGKCILQKRIYKRGVHKVKAKDIKEVDLGVKNIPIERITKGDPLWRYERINGKWVSPRSPSDYEKTMLKNLDKLPPIEVLDKGSHYELIDGAHRLVLHSHKGRKTIKARVFVQYI